MTVGMTGDNMSTATALATSTWARTHGIELKLSHICRKVDINQATLTITTTDTWRIGAVGRGGSMEFVHVTDGWTPDPFELLFGVWAEEEPTDEELAEAVEVLGAEAVADLAHLVGWR